MWDVLRINIGLLIPKLVLSSECAGIAIAMAIDKKAFVENILNNGSIPVNYYVPRYLAVNDEDDNYRT